MSAELKTKIGDIFPTLKASSDETDLLVKMFNEANWGSSPDFAHRPHHYVRVMRDAQCILGLHAKPHEKVLLEHGAFVHDFGRNLVDMGLINEEEHGDASFVVAKIMAVSEWGWQDDLATYFAEGIALHTEDVLPTKTHRWIRILRDADRTSRLGMSLMIDIASWMGYRDKYMEKTPAEQLIEDELLFDLSVPIKPDEIIKYDEKPRKYFSEHVLPWLNRENKVEKLVDGIIVFTDRIYGVRNTQDGNGRWKIEPVSKKAQFLAKPRVESMNRFLEENGYGQIPIPSIS